MPSSSGLRLYHDGNVANPRYDGPFVVHTLSTLASPTCVAAFARRSMLVPESRSLNHVALSV